MDDCLEEPRTKNRWNLRIARPATVLDALERLRGRAPETTRCGTWHSAPLVAHTDHTAQEVVRVWAAHLRS